MANDDLLFGGKGTRMHADSPLTNSPAVMGFLNRIGAKLISMTIGAIFADGEGGYPREVGVCTSSLTGPSGQEAPAAN